MISSAHLPLFVLAISQAAQAFKTTPRGTANATTDADNSRGSSSSSRSLPLSAIIGIVIGVMLIFALATCLFAVYFARQKTSPFSEQRYSYREEFDSPKTMVEPWGYVASPGLRGATTRDGAGEASGEYCSRTGEAARFGHIQLSHDPRCAIRGPDDAMPVQHAFGPNTASERDGKAGSARARSLSPPGPTHSLRPSTPDSFIIQVHKSVAEDASRLSKPQSAPAPGQPALSSPSEPTSSPMSTTSSPRWSSRPSPLSLPKIHIPKRNTPPSLYPPPHQPGQKHRGAPTAHLHASHERYQIP